MTRQELLTIAKPMLFNTEMMRANLDNRKTETRRVIKYNCRAKPESTLDDFIGDSDPQLLAGCARYKAGDIIYARETWYYESHMHELTAGEPDLPSGNYLHRYVYKADWPDYPVNTGTGEHGWRPSIHMPKEAARWFARIKSVHVERVQDITAEGIMREGAKNCGSYIDLTIRTEADTAWYKAIFEALWNSTIPQHPNKFKGYPYFWRDNPWVWVIAYERVVPE